MLPDDLLERVRRLGYRDAGHGYDPLGLTPDWVAFSLGLTRPLYEQWFRVSSHGREHLPRAGPAVLAANHSGTLPFDAMMVWTDVVRHSEPPRVPRTVLDHFVNRLPFVSVLYARSGAIGGSRGNVHEMLAQGEWVLVFPEGTGGIGKPFSQRYRLQHWTLGHAEMALRHRAPVVPVAVIGAEEQMPQLARLPIRLFGAPWLPLTTVPFPLPVHYHIWYGAPIALHDQFDPGQADDPAVVGAAAGRVREAVQALVDHGLAQRSGVFR